ncbi:hypothetical protein [Nocardia tenerifensis]|uniref:hypothetical protein n=1 Tax=Nocardia tenerifensis TaxID=228006 RepID=UPI0011B46453|nr:hypothetical protein [Nocardia tenerifensis]
MLTLVLRSLLLPLKAIVISLLATGAAFELTVLFEVRARPAAVIRLILIPALMQTMGRCNWWFPSFHRSAKG